MASFVAETSTPKKEVDTLVPGLRVFPVGAGNNYGATYQGFYYVFHVTGVGKHIFRCSQHRDGCHARIHLAVDYQAFTSSSAVTNISHTHPADEAYCQRKYVLWLTKVSGKTSMDTPAGIAIAQIKNLSPEVQAEFPKFESICTAARRARASVGLSIIGGSTRADLPLLERRFLTQGREDFLKWDSGKASDRILIFSKNSNLDLLRRSEHWFADGTFKTSPILFEQLFVIHGYEVEGINVICVPLVYVLTPNRNAVTYRRVFEQLKLLAPGLLPVSLMTDFEQALHNGAKIAFPSIQMRGCYFHFRQAVHRNIQRDPVLLGKEASPDFSLHMRYFVALAFVPASGVVAAFDAINGCPFFKRNKTILDSFTLYFLNTWIGGFNRHGIRKTPLFAIEFWNCYDSVLQDLPKTNNFCEGYHRGLASLLGVHHPALPKLVTGLMKDQSRVQFRMEQFTVGRGEPPTASSRRNAEKLKRKVQLYGTIPILQYLRSLATILKF